MRDPADERRGAWSTLVSRVAGAARAMRSDVKWMHGTWLELVFPGETLDGYSTVVRRKPDSIPGVVSYRLWAAAGVLLLLVGYPLFLLGLATRYYANRIDRLTASLGLAGVALVSLLVWGAFTVATYISAIAFEGFVAVGVAGGFATVSAVLALVVTRRGGRSSTVVVGYPLAMTALFLPPVVASLYSPTLAAIVFPSSDSLAIWLLGNVLDVGGIDEFLRSTFDLEGLAYVGMWFVIAVPIGWILGTLVTLVGDARQSRAVDGPEAYR